MRIELACLITLAVPGFASAQEPFALAPARATIDFVIRDHLKSYESPPVIVVDPARLDASGERRSGEWTDAALDALAGDRGVGRLDDYLDCPHPLDCEMHEVNGVVRVGMPVIEGDRASVRVRLYYDQIGFEGLPRPLWDVTLRLEGATWVVEDTRLITYH